VRQEAPALFQDEQLQRGPAIRKVLHHHGPMWARAVLRLSLRQRQCQRQPADGLLGGTQRMPLRQRRVDLSNQQKKMYSFTARWLGHTGCWVRSVWPCLLLQTHQPEPSI